MEGLTNNFLKFLPTLFFLITNSVCNESPSVIIVGAGVSGIAAAAELLENNITHLTILEAGDRIGGRIHTVPFGDNVVDLGAQWVHREQNNTAFEVAKKFDLLGVAGDSDFKMQFSTGKPIDYAFIAEVKKLFWKFYGNPSGNVSIGEYVEKKYTESIQNLYENDPEKMKLASEMLKLNLRYIMGLKGSFSPYYPSAESDLEAVTEKFDLQWKDRGYKTVLDILTKKYPNPEDQLPIDDKILFNKEVVEINWNDEKRVEVKCSDGSVYQADHVIVTVSLGVLKHSYETLFSPQLPSEKVSVIQDLGFDALEKVFVHFPNRWWNSNTSKVFLFVWEDEEKQTFLDSSEIDNSWIFDINAILIRKENPNVLLAIFTGSQIPKIELLPDDVVIDGLMSLIHKFLGTTYDNITRADAIQRHGWYTDPHFHGTNSYQTVKSRQHGESPEFILSKPLGGARVLFAGEATHPTQYSTVHGALESGRREAKRIIDLQ